jgi:glucokinase
VAMPDASGPIMLVDAGGTNVRFALADETGKPEQIRVLPTRSYPRFEDAASAYGEQVGVSKLGGAVIAMAGLIDGDRVSMTNGSWTFSRAALARNLGVDTLIILNDVEALALALPLLGPDDLVTIHPGVARPDGTRLVIALGTGLGAAALLRVPDGWLSLPTEGGHATFAFRGAAEFALAEWLETSDGRISNEDVLSGRGLVAIYSALSRSRGSAPEQDTAEAITAAALTGSDPLAVEAIALHARWLGRVAGDLVLVLNAHGGIYLAGGVTRHLLPLLISGEFAASFEAKGRVSDMVKDIPVRAVSRGEPALLGCVEAWRSHRRRHAAGQASA